METNKQDIAHYQPDVDIYENEREIVLVADVPGASREGISVDFEDDAITLEAKVAPRTLGGTSIREEYGVASFYRRFQLREPVDTGAAKADYSDGVLTVRLPKLRSAQAKRIVVQ